MNYKANGFLYLLVIGYPFIFYISFIDIKEKDFEGLYFSEKINNLNDYLRKINFKIRLINAFIEGNKNLKILDDNLEQKNMMLLKGFIKYHLSICPNNECPLKKFINSEGNFIIQRLCLLNYMNIYFNRGFKKFPNNARLLIIYIQFNYKNKFNLNRVKTSLLKLKNMECNIKDQYIIYTMEKDMQEMDNSKFDYKSGNPKNIDSQIDNMKQNYQKLKYLIENSIKLYIEFWGIFSTNITSISNTNILYSIGGKLNILLKEINNLWEIELKNKKINIENQYIVQLYSKFLSEILLDKKKSLEISNKLKYENLNNYNLNIISDKEDEEEKNKNISIFESLLDNEDLLLFCSCDEKGNIKIIQCSTSFSQLLGYKKYDIIGKPIEIIFPNLLLEGQLKYFEDFIKLSSNGQINNEEEILNNEEQELNKKIKLMVIKNSMGYILPLLATFKLLNDDDYSDTHLIKIKMDNKESKTDYSYYILTNQDLAIENISLGSIHLGLTLDLLKNYVVKIDTLIREENDKALNIYENQKKYEEEERNIIIWIYPYLIYPKDNNNNNNTKQLKEDKIEQLIQKSIKKNFNLRIKSIDFDNNNYDKLILLFKINEIHSKNKKNIINKINNEFFIPKCDKKLIMFDLINLRYIRTVIVNEKSGLRNLRDIENKKDHPLHKQSMKNIKNIKKGLMNEQENEYSETLEEKCNEFLLTKEKIIELQERTYSEIKEFIFTLPVIGTDISLERFRPNREKYSASKITESLIKIKVNDFIKIFHDNMNLEKQKRKNKKMHINNNNIESTKSSNVNNNLFQKDSSSSNELSYKKPDFEKKEINKELTADLYSSLTNIFKSNTIIYIRYLVGFLFLEILIFILIEFIKTNTQFKKLKRKIYFLNNGYKMLNNSLYVKHYVTEGVLTNTLNYYYLPVRMNGGYNVFIENVVNDLSKIREEFTEIFNTFKSNEICQEYIDFMDNTIINISTLTLSKPDNISILFNIGILRIYSFVNDLISKNNLMTMNNRETYEIMHNILNEYCINWQKVINILFNDSIKATNLKIGLMIPIMVFLGFSFLIMIFLLKLLSKLSLDREKPINLFLTLKRKVFENLKLSAENFSNKLLNKFFGNEENEDESQQDYQANIQPNDINIIKFKSANEHNYSIKKAFSFYKIIIIVFVYLIFYFFYFFWKYLSFRNKMENVFQFIILFDKKSMAQIDYILSYEIFRSFLYNKSIPILNNENTSYIFFENYVNLSNKIEDSIIYGLKTTSFLGKLYTKKFNQYFYGNFTSLDIFFEQNQTIYGDKLLSGLNPIEVNFREIIRFLSLKYCEDLKNIYMNHNDIRTSILGQSNMKLNELNFLIEVTLNIWYRNVLILLKNTCDDYLDKSILIFIVGFIVSIVFAVLYYFVIWRIYEEKLYILLKNSSDLINLIPQEIKKLIIQMLNE